jgi:hypothetical protein
MDDSETKQERKEGMLTAKEKRRKYVPKKKQTTMEQQSLPKNEAHSATNDDSACSIKKKRRKKRIKQTKIDRGCGTITLHHGETPPTATSVKNASESSVVVVPPPPRPNKKGKKEGGAHTDTVSHSPERPTWNNENKKETITLSSSKTKTTPSAHLFQVDETDHCETPLEAYKDIAILLEHFAKAIGKTRATLRIYDPYYCNGGVKSRLALLGFKTVFNENTDFYANIKKVRTRSRYELFELASSSGLYAGGEYACALLTRCCFVQYIPGIFQGSTPDYDVLLTNPPYSGTHIEKLLKFTVGDLLGGSSGNKTTGKKSKKEHGTIGSSKPFLLLLPHFVYTKDYYKHIFPVLENDSQNRQSNSSPFFLCPLSRYNYIPPQWVTADEGSKAVAKGKVKTAPFPSFWYCRQGVASDERTLNNLTLFLTSNYGESGVFRGTTSFPKKSTQLQYASCTAHIPREMRGELDENKKRPNPRARKRMLAKKRKVGSK